MLYHQIPGLHLSTLIQDVMCSEAHKLGIPTSSQSMLLVLDRGPLVLNHRVRA